ncbi:MAG: MFS transporter [Clostridia bacterium]|nr:MFS transporter [Clostridia bacterium]
MKKDRGQIYIIFLCWLLYTIAQLGRYSYSSNTTLIIDAYGVSHADAGLPTTYYFFAYGAGNIIVGLFCSRYNKRIAVTLALVVSIISNVLLFSGIDFRYIKYVWAANGFAQANLWPIMLLTLGQHLETKRMPFAAIVMSTASYGGTFLTYGISSLNSLLGVDFAYVFLFGAIGMFAVGALWFFTTKHIDDEMIPTVTEETKRSKFTASAVIMLGALMLFALIANAVSGGLKQWVPSILKESFHLDDWLAIFVSVALPLISIVTAFISAVVYDLLKNFILSSAIMFVIAAALMPLVITFLDTSWPVIMVLFVTIYVAMSVTINQLSVQAPLYLKDKMNSGFLAGLLNGACYIGSAVSTYVLGIFADNDGWKGAFNLLFAMSFLAAATAFIYYLFIRRKERENVDVEDVDL